MSKKEDQPAKGMKLESKYNPTLLRECIKNNNSASEIMEKLGITHKQTTPRRSILRKPKIIEQKEAYPR